MWYLLITIAHPDYKRPYSTSELTFYETRAEAEAAKEREYNEFVSGFDEIFDEETIGDWRKNLTREQIDSRIFEEYYASAYMDMAPFDAKVGEVKKFILARHETPHHNTPTLRA